MANRFQDPVMLFDSRSKKSLTTPTGGFTVSKTSDFGIARVPEALDAVNGVLLTRSHPVSSDRFV